MKVTLLAHTPDPERLVAQAAKICYSAAGIDEITEGLTKEKIRNFLKMLTEVGHESPVEHASFTFGIEEVSRSLLAQLTRHRMASFSVQSQRYVKEGQFQYIIPPEIEAIKKARGLFVKAMEADQKAYDKLADLLYHKHYKEMMKSGLDEKTAARAAEKKAIEDARYVLPNACDTKLMVTMNARSLYNFFRLRCCNRAQWEIRELAEKMLVECLRVAPTLFSEAGPPCIKGKCTEGSMSCGEAPAMSEKYRRLKDDLL